MRAGASCPEQSKAKRTLQDNTSCLCSRTRLSSALPLQMARMNSAMAALVLFLVAGFLLQSQAQPGHNSFCCFRYTQKPVPLRQLASYEVTSRCSLQAVVFHTKLNKKICANPNDKWAKDRMAKLLENGQQRNP